MVTIEVSEKADWKLFEDVARVLEQGLGGRWKEKLDGLDQHYGICWWKNTRLPCTLSAT
jgi:hypothetical protein